MAEIRRSCRALWSSRGGSGQDAVLEGCEGASNVRASTGWSLRSRRLVNRPGGWRSPVGHLHDNQFAATNESTLAQGEQGLRDERAAIKSARDGA